MDLSTLFNAVSRAISDRTGPTPDVDTGGFLNEVTGLFRQHADATGQQVEYGEQGYGASDAQPDILPASMDPLGDPADQEQTILPASQDPYGDPADQRR